MLASSSRPRGFTLVEVAVVVAIVAAVVALGYPLMRRTRPRAELAGLGTQLHALMQRTRQEALARGKDVIVLFYPSGAPAAPQGRILVIADDAGGFMAGAAPAGALNYCTMTPAAPLPTLEMIDLPNDVRIAAPPRIDGFPFPFSNVPAPGGGCSFCTGIVPGGGVRGAVRFDSRGRASFFADCGTASDLPNGGSVAITNTELNGSRILAILPSGLVRTLSVE